MARASRQREVAKAFLTRHAMARLSELKEVGVTAATVSRMERDGELVRLARGLYQMPDADLDAHHTLAEVAKLAPKGIVCLTSALAFHGITDQLPAKVWLAIAKSDWAPSFQQPPVRVVRMTRKLLETDIEVHAIEGVPVPIFTVARTVADCFRHRRSVGLSVAVEGLREALRQRKAHPAKIDEVARRVGISSVIGPYLEALAANG